MKNKKSKVCRMARFPRETHLPHTNIFFSKELQENILQCNQVKVTGSLQWDTISQLIHLRKKGKCILGQTADLKGGHTTSTQTDEKSMI